RRGPGSKRAEHLFRCALGQRTRCGARSPQGILRGRGVHGSSSFAGQYLFCSRCAMRAMSNTLAGSHVMRCVGCGTVQGKVDCLFRCSECGELLEVIYPDWGAASPESAQRLKKLWQERRTSTAAEDVSGVWRYRELLPRVEPR